MNPTKKHTIAFMAIILSTCIASAAPPASPAPPKDPTPQGKNASVFKPAPKPEEDPEKIALKKVQDSLAAATRSVTGDNIRRALEVTDNSGGLDNEAIIQPWLKFCEAQGNRVFLAAKSGNPVLKDFQRLSAVVNWCLENGLQIQPVSEMRRFQQNARDLDSLSNIQLPANRR
jgi:hypothetical protein